MSSKDQMLSVEDWLEKHYPNEMVLFSRRKMIREYAEYTRTFSPDKQNPGNKHLKHLAWIPIVGFVFGVRAIAEGEFYQKPRWFILTGLYQGLCVAGVLVYIVWIINK